jgi:hypothetical protein
MAVGQVIQITVGYYCFTRSCEGWPLLLHPPWRWLIEDVAIVALCLWSTLRAERYWVLWASVFALLQMVTDVLFSFARVTVWADQSAGVIWVYLTSAAILWGVWPSLGIRTVRRA